MLTFMVVILLEYKQTTSPLSPFDLRDELVVQDVLVFKGARLVVPTCMRKELMSESHILHT